MALRAITIEIRNNPEKRSFGSLDFAAQNKGIGHCYTSTVRGVHILIDQSGEPRTRLCWRKTQGLIWFFQIGFQEDTHRRLWPALREGKNSDCGKGLVCLEAQGSCVDWRRREIGCQTARCDFPEVLSLHDRRPHRSRRRLAALPKFPQKTTARRRPRCSFCSVSRNRENEEEDPVGSVSGPGQVRVRSSPTRFSRSPDSGSATG